MSYLFQEISQQLPKLLDPTQPLFPELEAARVNMGLIHDAPQMQLLLAQTAKRLRSLSPIPQTTYSRYRHFAKTGRREAYEAPYFEKRANLASAALHLFLGDVSQKEPIQDYLWNICEESNWVPPAHERRAIDLFAAFTGIELAETLALVGEKLDAKIRHRVRQEIENRLFTPYLRHHEIQGWWQSHDNWNGVCNSSIAMTFLWLERDEGRLVQALQIALEGLQLFVEKAFAADGSSSEGVGYWHYGLIYFVAFSEMLYARSKGQIDLLSIDKVYRIAAYPAKLQLSGSCFASFSDSNPQTTFYPGIIARLAQRTHEPSLMNLLVHPAKPDLGDNLTMMLRNILWWDGKQPAKVLCEDSVLPDGGLVRLVSGDDRLPIILAFKAGHNGENHNHNDIGSFILHVDGEDLLTDPGPGLYERAYFGEERYQNNFTNSYGHSVPKIGGQLQGVGRQFEGNLLELDRISVNKSLEAELSHAYPVPGLVSYRRQLEFLPQSPLGAIYLHDRFRCEGTEDMSSPLEIEEALMTWGEVTVAENVALIYGERQALRLTIQQPTDCHFRVEYLTQQSQENQKEQVLKRISWSLSCVTEVETVVHMYIERP